MEGFIVGRLLRPDKVEMIRPYLMDHPDTPRGIDALCREIEASLAQEPDNFAVFVALAADPAYPNGKVIGYLIARAVAETPNVWIHQTWVDSRASRAVCKKLVARVTSWAWDRGKKYLVAETSRNPDAVFRAFGFEPQATIIRKDVDAAMSKLESSIETAPSAEPRKAKVGNGRQNINPAPDEQPQPPAVGREPAALGPVQELDPLWCDPISGALNGPPEPGVDGDSELFEQPLDARRAHRPIRISAERTQYSD